MSIVKKKIESTNYPKKWMHIKVKKTLTGREAVMLPWRSVDSLEGATRKVTGQQNPSEKGL